MGFTYYSKPESFVEKELVSRKGKILEMSKRNAWIRVTSGVGNGMVILSNPSLPLFYASGAIYGGVGAQPRPQGTNSSETPEGETPTKVTDRSGKEIEFKDDRWGRPRPIISGIDISEGNNGLSKKMELQITCFSLAQMIEIQKKFQEPGHSVFIEFGWNTELGVKGVIKDLSNVTEIVNQRNLDGVQARRLNAKGHYDNFLGRITGGSLGIEAGEKFVVTTKLTGVGDLAAYLQGQKGTDDVEKPENVGGESFWWVGGTINDQKRQFQYFFNDLPSYNRTESLKAMINNEYFTAPENFINFDEELREDMGDETVDTNITYNGTKVNVPGNTPLVGQERFVKLDVLFRSILEIRKNDPLVPKTQTGLLQPIIYEDVPIRAFQRIFSTDKSKLLIPNRNMPDFGLFTILSGKTDEQGNIIPPAPISEATTTDQSYYGVSFPEEGAYDGTMYNELKNLQGYQYGFLQNLYVNYDFAKSVIESKTNDTYDMFMQILNGLSGAVNNFWNIEIELVNFGTKDNPDDRLVIVDKSLACDSSELPPLPLVLAGEQSIFLDASLDSNIPGNMLGNVVMGKASDGKVNVSPDGTTTAPKTGRGLFTNEPDWITGLINQQNEKGAAKTDTGGGGSKEDQIAAAYGQFQSKAGVYPKLIDNSADDLDWTDAVERLGFFTFDDPSAFRTVMFQDFGKSGSSETQIGQMLLPITFNFTVHGVSGFKRGDKFTIIGLPDAYSGKNGFFQVTQINQQVEGMTWKTQIEGKFRNAPKAGG